MSNRPELREQDYQARISAAETRKAMLRMLPGLEFSAGGHYDSNSFLTNQSWADYGVKVTWNLFNVLAGPTAIKVAEAGESVAQARRQAMSIAVMAQLYVARANLQEATRQFKTSEEMATLDGQIAEQLRNRYKTNNIGELELIQGELNNLQTQLKRDLSYAEMRNAYAQLFVSTGADPLPKDLPDDKVQTIADALQISENSWSR
ncbi:Outer membrane efflux protein [compost metagenome]